MEEKIMLKHIFLSLIFSSVIATVACCESGTQKDSSWNSATTAADAIPVEVKRGSKSIPRMYSGMSKNIEAVKLQVLAARQFVLKK